MPPFRAALAAALLSLGLSPAGAQAAPGPCAPAAPVPPCLAEAARAAEEEDALRALSLLSEALGAPRRAEDRAALRLARGRLALNLARGEGPRWQAALEDLEGALAAVPPGLAEARDAARGLRLEAFAAIAAAWTRRAHWAQGDAPALFDAAADRWTHAAEEAAAPGGEAARGRALLGRASLRAAQAERAGGGDAALAARIAADAWAAVHIANFIGDRGLSRAALPLALDWGR